MLRQFHQSQRLLALLAASHVLPDPPLALRILTDERREVDKLLHNSVFFSQSLKKQLSALHSAQGTAIAQLQTRVPGPVSAQTLPAPLPARPPPAPVPALGFDNSNPFGPPWTSSNPFEEPTVHTNPFAPSASDFPETPDSMGLVYHKRKDPKKPSAGLFIPKSHLEAPRVGPAPQTAQPPQPNLLDPLAPAPRPSEACLMDFGSAPAPKQDPRFDVNLL